MVNGRVASRGTTPSESDEQLTDRVRSGDQGAFAELYQRHRRAAESTARCLLRSRSDADDVVADAFAGVLSAIRNGSGPRDNFRRYLMACVRNGCRTRRRTIPIAPEDSRFESGRSPDGAPVLEDPERYIEADTVARAFSSLTPRWQQMLWSTAVEQKSAHEVGAQMGLSPNAVAALNHRAREAFATAYLAEHAAGGIGAECTDVSRHLAGYVRGQLPPARFSRVDRHVRDCATCTRAVDDLRDVNASLRSLGPGPTAAVAMLAAPAVRGSGGSTAPTSVFNVPYAGALLKGVAGLVLLAPLVVTGVELFRGGDTSPDVAIREVRQATTTTLGGDAESTGGAPSPAADEALPANRSPDAPPADVVDVAVVRPSGAPVASPVSSGPPGPPVPPAGAGSDRRAAPGAPVADTRPPSPTTAAPAVDVTEGLLGTLGVDDLVETAGLPELVEAVVAIDALVLGVTRDVVAPVLGAVIEALPVDVDPELVAGIPGVVLLPEATTAPTGAPAPAGTGAPSSGGGGDGSGAAPAGTPTDAGSGSGAGATAPAAPVATTVPPATAPTVAPAPPPTTAAGGLLPAISVPPIQVPVLPVPPITLPVITVPGLIG